MASVAYGSLPFKEQIAFFRRKKNVLTEGWTDVWAEQHDHAFMVAGVNRADMLEDFRDAIDHAIADGETLEQFRKRFDEIVAKYGWDYNGGRNWRSRVIYETNMRQSYNAGRFAQLQHLKKMRPFWRYKHADGEKYPRPLHEAWNNLVLSADDPWWQTHFPANGWGCKCYVEGLNGRDLKRMGKDGPDQAPPVDMQTVTVGQRSPGGPRDVQTPAGVDPGFGYAPGRKAWLDGFTPPFNPDLPPPVAPPVAGIDAMPPPSVVGADRLLPADTSIGKAVDAFLGEFGATRAAPAVFTDRVGEAVPISDALFNTPSGGVKDIAKMESVKTDLLLLADAIRDPDEIWLAWVPYKMPGGGEFPQLRRRYLRRAMIQDAEGVQQALAVFDLGRYGWNGTTTFNAEDAAYLEAQRVGTRIYRRKTEGDQ